MRIAIFISAICFASGVTACAGRSANTSQDIRREESHIRLVMPGLSDPSERYQQLSTAQYAELHYAGLFAKSAQFPRAQFSHWELPPGRIWRHGSTNLDEKGLREAFPYLKDQSFAFRTHSAFGRGGKTYRFEIAGTNCVALHASSYSSRDSAGGGWTTYGYYCAALGSPLGDSDIDAAISGVRIVKSRFTSEIPFSSREPEPLQSAAGGRNVMPPTVATTPPRQTPNVAVCGPDRVYNCVELAK